MLRVASLTSYRPVYWQSTGGVFFCLKKYLLVYSVPSSNGRYSHSARHWPSQVGHAATQNASTPIAPWRWNFGINSRFSKIPQ